MSDSRSWISDEEYVEDKKQKAREIEKVKNDPDYYRWRELREKYKEFDEYLHLKDHWEDYRTVKPDDVEITGEMMKELRKKCPLSVWDAKALLIKYNGNIPMILKNHKQKSDT